MALGKEGSAEWVWQTEMKTSAWALLMTHVNAPPEAITTTESHHSTIKMTSRCSLRLLWHLLCLVQDSKS